jgi:hypothetical protein
MVAARSAVGVVGFVSSAVAPLVWAIALRWPTNVFPVDAFESDPCRA